MYSKKWIILASDVNKGDELFLYKCVNVLQGRYYIYEFLYGIEMEQMCVYLILLMLWLEGGLFEHNIGVFRKIFV